MKLDERYQKDPSIVSRKIVGEVILVPIRQNVGDLESIFTLNESAARTWELLDGQRTLGQVLDCLVAEYQVGLEEAQQDLLELVAQLLDIRAIVKV